MFKIVFMNAIVHNRQLLLVLTFGILFGVIAAIAAFVNAYQGYSHFPQITSTKKIQLSLSIALGAFLLISGGVIIVLFFLQ
ncbi:MAG: hypothetical protein N3F66_13930 [Spirochaetes bacterium]|nr:hypothetical protein [Spirochaetota bacterium]